MTIVTIIIKTKKEPGMQDHNVAMFPVPQEKLLKRERGRLENAQ